MDTANLPQDQPCYVAERSKVPGYFSDEINGLVMSPFCALRAKSYAYKIEGRRTIGVIPAIKPKEKIRIKDIRKYVVDNHMTFEDHRKCLFGRSPYEAMFGCPVRLGVASVGFPSDQVANLITEEDIETIINSQLEKSPDDDIDIVNQQQENILSAREESVKCLEKQSKKMIKTSNRKLKCINVGTTVRIPIPDVDKARGSPRNVLAVVTDVQDGFYKLCTEDGFLKHRYTRTEIVPCDENFLDLKETTNSAKEKEITLREATGYNSNAGTQGYKMCHCKIKCQNNRCACRAAKKLCNSKCHSSLSCENK
ncbi:hypothetical protein QTP88_011641 [Uroleucon formosanum]